MMAPLLYFLSIALFAFVVLGASQIPNSIWLVACIFPVFIAMILGFVMWVFAWSEYSLVVSLGSLIVPIIGIVAVRRRLSTERLFAVICAAVVAGLVVARFAFIAADIG
jgi:hypothetical protein